MTKEPNDIQRAAALKVANAGAKTVLETFQRLPPHLAVDIETARIMDRISAADLRAKLGVDEKWINARLKEQECGFPQPVKESGRFYWSKKEIDRWMVAQVSKLYPARK